MYMSSCKGCIGGGELMKENYYYPCEIVVIVSYDNVIKYIYIRTRDKRDENMKEKKYKVLKRNLYLITRHFYSFST